LKEQYEEREMRIKRAITAVVFAAATTASAAVAQTPARPAGGGAAAPPPQRPPATAPATSAPVPQVGTGAGTIATIDIQAFGDQKSGIARLLSAYATLEREFKPRQDELRTLRTRYEALGKELEQLQKAASAVDQTSLQKKVDEMANLEKDIKRKQEDAQAAVERREQELTGPVWDDINNALRAYAAQRGISIILERSRLAGNNLIFVVNDNMDITREFITQYNQRNPATAAAAPANR
jgi:outer membrane protein